MMGKGLELRGPKSLLRAIAFSEVNKTKIFEIVSLKKVWNKKNVVVMEKRREK